MHIYGVYNWQLVPSLDSYPVLQAHDKDPIPVWLHVELLPQPPLLTRHDAVVVVVLVVVVEVEVGVVVVVVVVDVEVIGAHLRPILLVPDSTVPGNSEQSA